MLIFSFQLCIIIPLIRSYSCIAFLLRMTWSHPEVMKSFKHFFFSWSIKKDNLTQKIYVLMFSRQKEVWVDMFSVPISCATVWVYQHPLASDIICRLPVRPTYEVHLRKRITPKSKKCFENILWWSFEIFQLILPFIQHGSREIWSLSLGL